MSARELEHLSLAPRNTDEDRAVCPDGREVEGLRHQLGAQPGGQTGSVGPELDDDLIIPFRHVRLGDRSRRRDCGDTGGGGHQIPSPTVRGAAPDPARRVGRRHARHGHRRGRRRWWSLSGRRSHVGCWARPGGRGRCGSGHLGPPERWSSAVGAGAGPADDRHHGAPGAMSRLTGRAMSRRRRSSCPFRLRRSLTPLLRSSSPGGPDPPDPGDVRSVVSDRDPLGLRVHRLLRHRHAHLQDAVLVGGSDVVLGRPVGEEE